MKIKSKKTGLVHSITNDVWDHLDSDLYEVIGEKKSDQMQEAEDLFYLGLYEESLEIYSRLKKTTKVKNKIKEIKSLIK